jgi:hypothetical protein
MLLPGAAPASFFHRDGHGLLHRFLLVLRMGASDRPILFVFMNELFDIALHRFLALSAFQGHGSPPQENIASMRSLNVSVDRVHSPNAIGHDEAMNTVVAGEIEQFPCHPKDMAARNEDYGGKGLGGERLRFREGFEQQ